VTTRKFHEAGHEDVIEILTGGGYILGVDIDPEGRWIELHLDRGPRLRIYAVGPGGHTNDEYVKFEVTP
jgi:hypothetical protein